MKTEASRTSTRWATVVVLAIFVVLGYLCFRDQSSEDLASSYVGCRLIASGHTAELFTFDTDNFADIGPAPQWHAIAKLGNVFGYLHPYVQTPLWGFGLEPLCMHTQFWQFSRVFLVLVLLCFAASIYLVARFWTPSLLKPLPLIVILLLFGFSQPFRYAMFLMQTHALFFFLAIASLILAEHEQPLAAGLLLACAAAVKITPGFLLLYWLLQRRWKAVGYTILFSAVLAIVTVLSTGPVLFTAYLATLHRISRVLLVAQNNQSFAAWVMGHFFPFDEIFDITIYPLPAVLRLGSSLLMAGFILWGGWIDRAARLRKRAHPGPLSSPPPIGAMMALVAVTVFAPICWTHYAVILVAPLMVLWAEGRRLRSPWLLVLVGITTALNFEPIATDVIRMDVGNLALVRGQFYAFVLCLLGVAAAAWLRTRANTALSQASAQPA